MTQQKFLPVSLFLLLLIAGCKSRPAATAKGQATGIPVKIERVQPSTVANEVRVSGNVEGNTTVKLGFLVGGKINYIFGREGQPVSRGQLVASLEPTNYLIARQLADVQVGTTSDEFSRLKLLHDRKSLSESDFIKIDYALQQAKLQQQLQQKNLADTKLWSPIDGVLIKKSAEVGEIVGVGAPQFAIADIRKVKVLAYIPEDELHLIKTGQQATVLVSALNKTFAGRVIEIGAAADETSRAFTIKIEIVNLEQLIRPGMIAEAAIMTNSPAIMTLVPAEAIINGLDNQQYVYVVDSVQNKAFRRKISLGKMMDNKIQVTEGLSAGDLIVEEGQNKLTDGAAIALK
jgi:membrane fusion protein (multidrug efflux system)